MISLEMTGNNDSTSKVDETIGDEEIEHFFPVDKISLEKDDLNLLWRWKVKLPKIEYIVVVKIRTENTKKLPFF